MTLQIRILFFSGLLLFFAGLGSVHAALNTVKNVYVTEHEDNTKIVFNLDDKAKYDVFRLSNPNRIVVDINQSQSTARIPGISRHHDVIKNIRSARRNNHAQRFVIDTRGKVDYETYRLKPNKKYGHRLVLALKHSQQQIAAAPVVVKPKPQTVSLAKAKTNTAIPAYREVIVAIDAGHGGQDPGASGKHGTREKDVVLEIAKKLKRLVDSQPGMRGVLVRKDDTYITLRERINIAREANADMFISIHADAYQNRNVKGSSVYILSERGASDEAAKWLADRENASDLIGGVSLDDKDETLAKVLLDLSQTATIDASSQVATHVLSEIHKVAPVHRKSVQHARFVVLKSPDIPSLLVETAFISNPHEERRLKSDKYQNMLARAMLKGVKKYFEQNPPEDTLVAMRNQAHKVKPGDTLSVLAQEHRVSVAELKSFNNLKSDKLMVGQTIHIPF